MDRVRGSCRWAVALRPPAGGGSFLEPNGSQINEILICIIIFIYIIIVLFISRSLQGRVGSGSGRIGSSRVGSEQGRSPHLHPFLFFLEWQPSE